MEKHLLSSTLLNGIRRKITLIIVALSVINVAAQVQQGYIKTIGRPNNPGKPIGGVTVRVSGNINTVVSNQGGTFSFPIKEQRFKFSRVSKKGYELADPDFFHYDFGFNPNAPVTVAMVSKEELQRERDAIEERTRYKLTLRFQEQNAILERKLEQKMLSEEEFKMQLLSLNEKFDNIDTLVSILSDRYARTDYDNIDSLRLVINQCIENGELERAQQLILSKGSLDERAKELEDTRKLRLQIQGREEKLQKDLAADYYQLYEIAKTQQKNDSAYYYLEKRYLTDTTQVNYLRDLALSRFFLSDFPVNERHEREIRHESYLLRLYSKVKYPEIASQLGLASHQGIAKMENELGYFYHKTGNDEKALLYYRKLLNTIKEGNLGKEISALRKIASIFLSQELYKESLSTYQEAMNYCKKDGEREILLKDIASLHYFMGDKDLAIKEFIDVERIYTVPNDSDTWYIRQLWVLQGFIAHHFYETGNYKEAVVYYSKAVKNAERIYNITNETKNLKTIVNLLRQLQESYAMQGNFKQAYSCAEKAMSYAETYMKRFPSSYSRLLYAEALCQMADAHANLGKTTSVEKDLVECLKLSEFASYVFEDRYRQLAYRIYNAFATSFAKQKQYNDALNAVNKAISILPDNVMGYQRKITILKSMGKKDEANMTADKLADIDKNPSGKDNNSQSHSTDPLWEYEYIFLRNS